MFCNNCGTQLPEGSQFCPTCGTQLSAPEAQAYDQSYAYQQNYQQQPYQQPYAQNYQQPNYYQNGPVMKKKEYLSSTLVSPKAKQNMKLAWVFFGICALILILALNASINGPAHKIPILRIAMGERYYAMIEEGLEYAGDHLEDLEEELEDLDGSELQEAKEYYEASKALVKDFSLRNINKYADLLDIDDEDGVYSIFMGVSIGFFIFNLLLLVLAGFLRSTGLTVFVIFPSIIYAAALCGLIYVPLILISYIVLAVFYGKINSEYKTYKKNARMAMPY